jgi:hypothetical protein
MSAAPRRPTIWSALRIVAAALVAVAIVAQASRTIGGAISEGRDVATTTVNFFSFFTVLSNVSSVVVLAIAGIRGFVKQRQPEPYRLSVAIACVSTYMVVTGIVYNLLLRGVPLPQGTTVPWSNEVLHVVGPVFLLVDIFVNLATRLPWKTVATILVFPVLWILYTLVRGPLVTNPVTSDAWWYPYPFLDPHLVGGYGGVAVYVVGIAVALGAVAAGVVAVGRRRAVVQPA